MKRIVIPMTVLIILISLGSSTTKPITKTKVNIQNNLEDYVRITTDGSYTFLASIDNVAGEGESETLPLEYFICKYAVTNAKWKDYVDAVKIEAPSYWVDGKYPEGKANHPVLWVSARDAEAYCKWLSDKTEGWTFRLPSEAEWEYAAVGDLRRNYPWGNTAETSYSNSKLSSKFNYNAVIAAEVLKEPDRMATYNNPKSTRFGEQDKLSDIISVNTRGQVKGWVNHANHLGFIYTDIFSEINATGGNTCAVDSYPEGASWCGCLNMCGNCWEWTSTLKEAQNGAEKGQIVNAIRGGSWYANPSSCKASFRGEGRKGSMAYNTVGIRLVAVKSN